MFWVRGEPCEKKNDEVNFLEKMLMKPWNRIGDFPKG